jgi:hypothetical protein
MLYDPRSFDVGLASQRNELKIRFGPLINKPEIVVLNAGENAWIIIERPSLSPGIPVWNVLKVHIKLNTVPNNPKIGSVSVSKSKNVR